MRFNADIIFLVFALLR